MTITFILFAPPIPMIFLYSRTKVSTRAGVELITPAIIHKALCSWSFTFLTRELLSQIGAQYSAAEKTTAKSEVRRVTAVLRCFIVLKNGFFTPNAEFLSSEIVDEMKPTNLCFGGLRNFFVDSLSMVLFIASGSSTNRMNNT